MKKTIVFTFFSKLEVKNNCWLKTKEKKILIGEGGHNLNPIPNLLTINLKEQ